MLLTDYLADLVRNTLRLLGLELTRYCLGDIDPESMKIINRSRPLTLTSPARLFALIQAVKYVVQNDIPGDFVECGVWKGGSMVAIALTLRSLGVSDRKLYLFDTFSGMTSPGQYDVSEWGTSAAELLKRQKITDVKSVWCNVPLDSVRAALEGTGYPSPNIKFVPGKVEETLPGKAPSQIALLRLDTDWYESTRHELSHLYPLLSYKGVLIIDDYGAWLGARKAVDEYFEQCSLHPLLHKIDYTGRIALKL